jgi:hypothetical protein
MSIDDEFLSVIDSRIDAAIVPEKYAGTVATTNPVTVLFDGSGAAVDCTVAQNVVLDEGDRVVVDKVGSDYVITSTFGKYQLMPRLHDFSGIGSPDNSPDGNVKTADLFYSGQESTVGVGVPGGYRYLAQTSDVMYPYIFSHQGTLTVGTGTARLPLVFPGYYAGIRCTVNTAPSGSSIRIGVGYSSTANGTVNPIWTSSGNRPVITSGSFMSALPNTPDISFYDLGGYLRIDIETVGSTTAGANLVVALILRMAPLT